MDVIKGEWRPDNRCVGHREAEIGRDQFNVGDDGWCINTHNRATAWDAFKAISGICLVLGAIILCILFQEGQ